VAEGGVVVAGGQRVERKVITAIVPELEKELERRNAVKRGRQ